MESTSFESLQQPKVLL